MSADSLTVPGALVAPAPAEVVALSRQVLAKHARTFRMASLLLSPQQRDEAAIVYAFCRLVDDTVDEAADLDAATRASAALTQELRGEVPARPLIKAFRALCVLRDIPMEAAHELIRGVESDLGVVRFADDAELLRYCYQVASTVGLMMCGVIGVEDPQAPPFAVDLGVGMQLTNICRDVLEDAGRGRVYLPESRLQAAGTSQAAIMAGEADPDAVGRVVRDLLLLAQEYYASGRAGMRYIPLRPRAAIAAASRMYRGIGDLLMARGCKVMGGRTIVSGPGKAWRLAAAVVWTPWAGLGAKPVHNRELHKHLAGLPGCSGH